MRSVGIKALKNDLSSYVRAAKAGETVLVTDRGEVVAELRPHRASPLASEDEAIARMVREGILTPAAGTMRDALALIPPGPPEFASFEEFMAFLDEGRSDR